MKRIVFFLVITLFSISFSCDLSGILGLRPDKRSKGTGFSSIVTTARPVYLKTEYDGWNLSDWEKYSDPEPPNSDSDEDIELTWWDLSKSFEGTPDFTASLTERSKYAYSYAVRAWPGPGIYHRGAEMQDQPDRVNQQTYPEVNKYLRALDPPTSSRPTYALGDQIQILIDELNYQNHYIMPNKTVVHSSNEKKYYFAIKYEIWHKNIRATKKKATRHLHFHAKEPFVYQYARKDIYTPLHTLEFETFTFTLNKGARVTHFAPSNLVENHQINSGNLTEIVITMKSRPTNQLGKPLQGQLFKATIQSEAKKSENHSFYIFEYQGN